MSYLKIDTLEFMADTADLDMNEVGAYTKLLIHQRNRGRIEIDRLPVLLGNHWERLWHGISFLFQEEDGEIWKPEVEKQARLSTIRTKNGAAGGNAKQENIQKSSKTPSKQPSKTPSKQSSKTLTPEESLEDSLEKLPLSEIEADLLSGFTNRKARERAIKEDPELKYELTTEEHDRYVSQFIRTIHADGERQKSLREGRKHFSRWLKMEIGKKLSRKPNTSNISVKRINYYD